MARISLFKSYLMGLLMLSAVVLGAHREYRHQAADMELGASSIHEGVNRFSKRDEPLGCQSITYSANNPVGQQVTCPFEWIVNYESKRIPEQIVEQVCQQCRSCGPNRQCTQLKVQYQVYYRDTAEFSQQVVRAGCVCKLREIGQAAASSSRTRFSTSSLNDETGDESDFN